MFRVRGGIFIDVAYSLELLDPTADKMGSCARQAGIEG